MIDTLSYDYGRGNTENGWISRYSYHPEWMIGLNNTMYTFSGGNIFMHDSTTVDRTSFYGTKGNSLIVTEFNESPFEKKMFKTIHLDSDSAWDAVVDTDLSNGVIDADWFQRKEGDWFAYIRRVDATTISDEDAVSLSTQGIGVVFTFVSPQINFTTAIDSSVFAVGDRVYKVDPILGFVLVGIVSSSTTISISLSGIVSSVAPGDFVAVGKNKVAESYGMRGYHMTVTLANDSDDAVELFAVSSSIFKSFP